MSKADDIFYKEFGGVLAAIVVFAFVVYFLANAIGGYSFARVQNSESAVNARIVPSGSVRIGAAGEQVAAAAPAKPAAAPAAAAGGGGGEQVYNTACLACHATGVAGAPKLGDKAAWEPRTAQGLDSMIATVIKGKGAMPPKAGNPSLTEDDIRSAINFMLGKAGLATAAPAAATADSGSSGGEAGKQPEAKPAIEAVATAAAPAAAAVAAAPAQAAVAAAPAQAAAAAAPAQAAAAAAPAKTAAPAAPAKPAAADGKPGVEVYNSACLACHTTGVANAPKLGDKAAWEARAQTGMDALMATALKGKGAMPPKGGNPTLSDADIRNAIQYMLTKAGVSG